ncbi:hypothetical protein NLJ89_g9213 [Agrocybe chaxingu]|uniref:Uncharacterized protein n=1 Tax=Agrocybe chaxingu TaxID=84603 RepID=A0A9W8JTS1_9AGAR|nr:hypothetical protein NLJ89_g9213 [Agrocybe chaxingu]
MNDQDSSRPTTPESPLDSSLYHATSTIDDLTAALADFSRVPSPEPVSALSCCCGREDCENFKAWLELKSRLGSRLVLSAEVGQALLQRHEAYVRQTERKLRNNMARYPDSSRSESSTDNLNRELDELMKEKQQLEKRLNQALVNNEVTEVSSKTILQELQEARETISRLTAHHARSIGWDTRLSAAMKERDDMQQERDGETHRARLAESRFAALKEKTAKLQAEVRRLQESLEQKRQHRLESSENLIQDARSRLESFRNSHLGVNAKLAEEELTSVLESLVQDNETLQRDNAELQHLLSEAREDLHALQEEVEESRANPPPPSRSGANTPHSRHFHSGSVTSMFSPRVRRNASSDGTSKRRQAPAQIDVRLSPVPPGPPTPNALRSPMLTVDSLAPAENKWAGQSSPRSSHISYELDNEAEEDGSPPLYERPRGHRPLLLLTRSRAVQTDSTLSGTLSPSPFPSHVSSVSPHDPRSESSSFSETPSSHVSLILERLASLFNRFTQADALTLTNRLKRQNLKGADVGHLSRSTINNIVSEATGLRAQYRSLLEDEKVVTSCTRKDLRMLFKLVKDMFSEMANLRITLNDVILDPSSAPRISELSLNPGKAEAETREKEREGATEGGVSGWMAPISKLFSPVGRSDPVSDRPGLTRSSSARAPSTRPQRFVPKLGPALAASATTVNVEFSGSGVGRAVTSSFSAQPIPVADSSMGIATTSQSVSSGLMDIFAGAPKPIENADPWVILPTAHSEAPPPTQVSTLRMSQPFMKISESTATIGRTTGRKNANRLSRNVDAVIDVERPPDIDEEPDYLPPLTGRRTSVAHLAREAV